MTPDAKAELLLQSLLSPQQRKSWQENDAFECTGSLGTRYRIGRGPRYGSNVHWFRPNGTVGGSLCAHPSTTDPSVPCFRNHARTEIPEADLILGQFLTLTCDEEEFLRHANGSKFPPAARNVLRKSEYHENDLHEWRIDPERRRHDRDMHPALSMFWVVFVAVLSVALVVSFVHLVTP